MVSTVTLITVTILIMVTQDRCRIAGSTRSSTFTGMKHGMETATSATRVMMLDGNTAPDFREADIPAVAVMAAVVITRE
jgi:hypothetical protein